MSLANAWFILQSSRQSLELLQLARIQVAIVEQGERATTEGPFEIAVSLPYPPLVVLDSFQACYTLI